MKTLLPSIIALFIVTFFFSCVKNEYPPVVADQEFSIAENSSEGTIVGAVEAHDPDEGQIISYEIIDGNADSVFQINSANGIIKIYHSELLNYEECTEYNLTVLVSDNFQKEPKETSSNVHITVIDINEFTPEVRDTVFTLNENQAEGFEIGRIESSDGDIYQDLVFSIPSAASLSFVKIDPLTGMLSVNDSSAFDYETRQEIVFEVRVSDNQEVEKSAIATIHIVIQNVLEITDGLVAYLPFDGDASDASGNNHNGIVEGPVLSQDRNGNSNSAYYFDGIDDIIRVPDHDSLSFPDQQFSISVWFNPYELKNIFVLYKGSTTYNREYSMGINPNYLSTVAVFDQGSATESVGTPSTTVLKKDEWVHTVGTWDGEYLSIYLNGKFENKIACNMEIGNFSSDIFIGSYGGRITDYAFYGVIDEIYIHNRVLQEDEIAFLAGNGPEK